MFYPRRMMTCTGSECEHSQSRVLASLGWEAGAVGHVKPLRFPALVVRIEHRVLGRAPHTRSAGLVNGAARRLWHRIDASQSYARKFSQLPQCCNLLAPASQLPISVSTVYAQ